MHAYTHTHYFITCVPGVAPLCGEQTKRPLATSVCVDRVVLAGSGGMAAVKSDNTQTHMHTHKHVHTHNAYVNAHRHP